MSNTSDTRRTVEKQVNQSQDVGGPSSKSKKPRAHKVILRPPPLVLSDEEEEEPLRIHSPIEHPGGQRTFDELHERGLQEHRHSTEHRLR
jgi:hypothetical protein